MVGMPSPLGADLLAVVARINRLANQRVRMPIPFAQARLLSTIEDQGEARISDLAALDHCSQPTMTTQVRRLEDAGMVTRTPDPPDARAVLIRITPTGSRHCVRPASIAVRPSTRTWSGSATRSGSASPRPSTCCGGWSRTPPRPAAPPADTHAVHHLEGARRRMWRQPRAVWAVAFASVIAFMGIGLVDPILKPIADDLDATPSQVSLLFTSYMAVMGVAMLITGVVSSRIGAKRTLLVGLALIIAGAGAGRQPRLRSGHRRLPRAWGLGNALFIATALADDRRLGPRLGGAGDHPLRGRTRARHRRRAARRWPARLDLAGVAPSSASSALMAVALRRHRDPAALDTAAAAADDAWPTRSARCATAACSPSRSPRCSTTSASSRCWRSRRSRST